MLFRFLHLIHGVCFRFPRLTVVCFVLSAALLCVSLRDARVLLTVDDMPSASFPEFESHRLARRDFQLGAGTVFAFHRPEQPLTASDLCAIRKWIVQLVRTEPGLLRMQSAFHLEQLAVQNGQITTVPVLALDCTSLDRAPHRQDEVDHDQSTGPNPENGWAQDLSGRAVALALNETPARGLGVSTSGQTFIVTVEQDDPEALRGTENPHSLFAGVDPFSTGKLISRTNAFFAQASQGLQIAVSGNGAFRWFLVEALVKDQVINVLMLVIAMFSAVLLFGSFRMAVLFVIKLTLLAALLLGSMATAGASLDTFSNSLLLLVTVSASQDFILFLQEWRDHHQRDQQLPQKVRTQMPGDNADWARALRSILEPSFLTSLTSALAFLCLLISDYPPLRSFGFWAAWGVLLEWMVTFLFLPSLLKEVPWLAGGAPTNVTGVHRNNPNFFAHLQPAVDGFLRQCASWPGHRLLTVGALMALAAMPFSLSRLHINDSPGHHFPAGHPLHQFENLVRRELGWSNQVAVRTNAEFTAAQWESLPGVTRAQEPQEMLGWATARLEPEAVTLAQVDLRTSREGAASFHFPSGDQLVRLYVGSMTLESLETLQAAVDNLCTTQGARCTLVDTAVSYTAMVRRLLNHLLAIFLSSSAVVVATVSVVAALRRPQHFWKATPALLAGAFVGPALTIHTLAICGSELGLTSALGIVVLIGMAGDNAIHYLWASDEKSIDTGISRRSVASVKIAAFCLLVSSTLLMSALTSVQALGWFLLAGLFFGLVGDLWVVKGMVPATSGIDTRCNQET